MRPLTIFQPLDAEAADIDLTAAPGAWLPEGSRPAGPGAWNVPLRLGGLTRTVRCEVGDPVRVGRAVWRSMTWTPVSERGDSVPAERLLPAFDGEIGLHVTNAGETTIVLNGAYSVPLGAFGEAIDAMVLNRAARSTATRFLADLARAAIERSPQPVAVGGDDGGS
jgi:hypothetical protein